MCRILETVIAPAVVDDHAAEILRGVIGNLGSLVGTWKQLAPFLHWDTLEMRALLRDHPALDGELASDIAVELAEKVENSFDIDALSRRNDALRELLARCIADPRDRTSTRLN